MPSAEPVSEQPGAPHALLVGVSPKVVRDHLLPTDRQRFDAAYEAALDEARRSYELGGVHDVVEHWRQIAVLQSDPVAFRHSVRVVAEIVTCEPMPEGESFEVTRRKAGMEYASTRWASPSRAARVDRRP